MKSEKVVYGNVECICKENDIIDSRRSQSVKVA